MNKKTIVNNVPYCIAGLVVFEQRILDSLFSPAGHECSPKSATQHAPTVVVH